MKSTPSQRSTMTSRFSRALLFSLVGLSIGFSSISTAQGFSRSEKAMVEGYTDRSSYVGGETARILARVMIADTWHIQAHVPTYDYLIPTELGVVSKTPGVVLLADLSASTAETGTTALQLAEPSYPKPYMWSAPFAGDEILAVYEGETFIEAAIQIPPGTPAGDVELELVLYYQACDDRVCLAPTDTSTKAILSIGAQGEPQYQDLFKAALATRETTDDSSAGGSASASAGRGLAWMLGFGFIGGLLLNLMPCVLPVLSIKVFGLLQSAEKGQGSVRSGALAFAAGIMVSFWALGAAAIGLRAAGEAIGWGIQFQNPMFVAFLTLVMLFFSLNLWGLFEIPLPAFLGGQAQGGGNGPVGHFTAGLFATLMATPCSAPFLGSAVGFALARPPATILAIFTAVGLGLAAPNLLLAISPKAAGLLPRPGAWMETLKGVFGFLLAGTAVWLLYVLNNQIAPESLAFVEGTLLLVGLFAYLHHRWQQQSVRRLSARLGLAAAALATLWIASTAPAVIASGSTADSDYAWVNFDEAEALELASSGDLVFVDVTADWCATCKVNERVVLHSDTVQAAFKANNVVMMKADWTNRNETIANYLADFGRYAIPFYVLYRPNQEPHVFGELLTKRTVIKVLEESV